MHDVCRHADQKAAYVSLALPMGIEVDVDEKLTSVPFIGWSSLGPDIGVLWCWPGGYEHITLDEADCALWSMGGRLQRPTELGKRIGQGRW